MTLDGGIGRFSIAIDCAEPTAWGLREPDKEDGKLKMDEETIAFSRDDDVGEIRDPLSAFCGVMIDAGFPWANQVVPDYLDEKAELETLWRGSKSRAGGFRPGYGVMSKSSGGVRQQEPVCASRNCRG